MIRSPAVAKFLPFLLVIACAPPPSEPTPDAGQSTPDASETAPDASETTPDAGETTPDAGEPTPDAGETTPDAGETTPDAGEATPDAGEVACTDAFCAGLLCDDAPTRTCPADLSTLPTPQLYWSMDVYPGGASIGGPSFAADGLIGKSATVAGGPTFDTTPHRSAGRFSSSIWIKPASYPASGHATFVSLGTGQSFTGWMLALGADGVVSAIIETGSAQGERFVSGGTACLGKWTHVALRVNFGTATLYVDGVPVATSDGAGMLVGDNPLRLGSQIGGTTVEFDGALDEFAYWDRVISQDEAQSLTIAGDCRTKVRESDVVPVSVQVGSNDVCATAFESSAAMLSCPMGMVITAVTFASFGTPENCARPIQGSCHAAGTKAAVEATCLGQNSCTVDVSNGTFGGDPCFGIAKSFTAVVTCSQAG